MFNSSLPGCETGGLSGGQIAGIVIGAVAAAAMAITVAAWGRAGAPAPAGNVNAGQSPLAQVNPGYVEPGAAGVMPEL